MALIGRGVRNYLGANIPSPNSDDLINAFVFGGRPLACGNRAEGGRSAYATCTFNILCSRLRCTTTTALVDGCGI